MSKGTGYIDVAVELLPKISHLLPSTYKIIGSMDAPYESVIRFVVESDDLSGHGHALTCTVKDAGSTRSTVVHPIEPQPDASCDWYVRHKHIA